MATAPDNTAADDAAPNTTYSGTRSWGTRTGYKLLGLMLRLFGYTVAAAITRAIVFYYFLFSPRVVGRSMRFYGVLYPEEGRFDRWRRAWHQFRSFSTVFLDRLLVAQGSTGEFQFEHEGLERFAAGRGRARPTILWMSHLGNWEVACRTLCDLGTPMTLVMGAKQGERVEAEQKVDLERAGIRLLLISESEDLAVVELVKALRTGEVVAVAGDRLFDERQKSIEVEFLGRPARVPVGPYVLAALTCGKLIPIFGLREGRLSYRFLALSPVLVDAADRSERQAAISRAAATCFAGLEEVLRRYPDQWYNFYDFWMTNRGSD